MKLQIVVYHYVYTILKALWTKDENADTGNIHFLEQTKHMITL